MNTYEIDQELLDKILIPKILEVLGKDVKINMEVCKSDTYISSYTFPFFEKPLMIRGFNISECVTAPIHITSYDDQKNTVSIIYAEKSIRNIPIDEIIKLYTSVKNFIENPFVLLYIKTYPLFHSLVSEYENELIWIYNVVFDKCIWSPKDYDLYSKSYLDEATNYRDGMNKSILWLSSNKDGMNYPLTITKEFFISDN